MSCNPSQKIRDAISQTTGINTPELPNTKYNAVSWRFVKELLEANNRTLSAGIASYQLIGGILLGISKWKNDKRMLYAFAKSKLDWLMSPLLDDSDNSLDKTIRSFVEQIHNERLGRNQSADYFFIMAYLFKPKNKEQERRRHLILSSDYFQKKEDMFLSMGAKKQPLITNGHIHFSVESLYPLMSISAKESHNKSFDKNELDHFESLGLMNFLEKEMKESLLENDLYSNEKELMETLNITVNSTQSGFMTIKGSVKNMLVFKNYIEKNRERKKDGSPFINIGETTSKETATKMFMDCIQNAYMPNVQYQFNERNRKAYNEYRKPRTKIVEEFMDSLFPS